MSAVETKSSMSAVEAKSGAYDFDFWMGRWNAHNRVLRERLVGSDVWDEFASVVVARPLPGGLGNEDLYCTEFGGGFIGMSFRFFDPELDLWSIYWADGRRPGVLDPPVFGSFSDDMGLFLGEDTLAGRPILVQFLWSGVTTSTPHWEQAFSDDGGETWETNWVMDFTRGLRVAA
jgi:hypothetical protein